MELFAKEKEEWLKTFREKYTYWVLQLMEKLVHKSWYCFKQTCGIENKIHWVLDVTFDEESCLRGAATARRTW